MIKVVTLCSGSKGNSTYIEINKNKILLDAGASYRYLKESLNKISIDINEIDYVFVTHNHKDHVQGLVNLIKYSKAKLCISKLLYETLKEQPIEEKVVFFEDQIELDDITIKSLNSSHDAPVSKNYIISYQNKKISLITDSGYVKQNQFKYFYNSDLFLMESNHDIDMLQNSKYPHYLKQRILGDEGHLSNNQAGFYLSKIIGPKTKKVILIHLSEENNDPVKAINKIEEILDEYNIEFNEISYARQFELSEVIKID